MNKVIGSCSLCGGPVVAPDVWYGINLPTPTCVQCGAKARPSGPVIPMQTDAEQKRRRTLVNYTPGAEMPPGFRPITVGDIDDVLEQQFREMLGE